MASMNIRVSVVSISDTRKLSDDISGDKLSDLLVSIGAEIVDRSIVTDDLEQLSFSLARIADREDIDLIITTGGTGFAARDNTPEATRAVIEREAPGISEAMRRETAAKQPMAMLSRGVCGIRGKTLIINLPGSPKGVEECFEVVRPVLKHAINLLSGDTCHDPSMGDIS